MPSDGEEVCNSKSNSEPSSPVQDIKKRSSEEDIEDGNGNQLQSMHLPLKKQYMQDHHAYLSPTGQPAQVHSSPTIHRAQSHSSPIILHSIDIDDSLSSTLEIDAPVELSTNRVSEPPATRTVQPYSSKSSISKSKTMQPKATKHLEEVNMYFFTD